MVKILVLSFFSAVQTKEPSFEEWADQFGMNSADEDMRAKYEINVARIEELNAMDDGATYGVNQFSGMSFEEFEAQMLTEFDDTMLDDIPILGDEHEIPEVITDTDWESTPVKNQGNCGSCWAFGTMGAIETVWKHKMNQEIILAEQQLLDCNKGNAACNGGDTTQAFEFLVKKDIYTQESYPYIASSGSCRTGKPSGARISGYTITARSDAGLASGVEKGAMTVSLKPDDRFFSYKSGIISNPPTTCKHSHAVVLVGATSQYFRIKNSWGANWGEGGFMRMARVRNSDNNTPTSTMVVGSPRRRAPTGCCSYGLCTKGGLLPQFDDEVEV